MFGREVWEWINEDERWRRVVGEKMGNRRVIGDRQKRFRNGGVTDREKGSAREWGE